MGKPLFLFPALFYTVSILRINAESDSSTTVKYLEDNYIHAPELAKFQFKQLDPLTINEMSLNIDTSKMTFGLVNGTLSGLRQCQVITLQRNVKKLKLIEELSCNILLDTDYIIKGELSSIVISGSGTTKIRSDKIFFFHIETDYEEYTGEDGKRHLKIPRLIKSPKGSGETVFNIDIQFSGEGVKTREARTYSLKNPKGVVEEFSQTLIPHLVTKFIENTNEFFSTHAISY
nr:venom protein U-MPTX.19-41 [Megalopyge opercularis]